MKFDNFNTENFSWIANLDVYQVRTNIIILIIILVYYLYKRKYMHYRWIQKVKFTRGRRIYNNSLPSVINGWFWVCNSSDIPKGKTYYFDKNGSNIVLFRGENDEKIYAIDAYCSHMGANLVDGKVKNNCITCPFHNWMFSGETGICLSGKNQKQATQFKYTFFKNSNDLTEIKFSEEISDNQANSKKKRILIKSESSQEANSIDSEGPDTCDPINHSLNLKNYITYENSGIIYIFIHAVREKELNPDYYPLDLTVTKEKLTFRGKATNMTKNQFQDMPENGADIAHFLYIHPQIIPGLIYAKWNPKWIAASSENIFEETKSTSETITKFRHELIRKYINPQNKDKIGIVTLDNKVSLFNKTPYFDFFGLIGFQVGPGLVYLFMKSFAFETLFFQYVEIKGAYEMEMHHEIFTNNYLPYWISALKLKLESDQVTNDCVVWDNKKFASNPWYNTTTEADQYLIKWRKFFCQFYEGCLEKEKKLKVLRSDW